MLFHPAIMALELASFVFTAMAAVAAGFAIQIVRHWDITSGSERQISLERRTYLVSTLLAFVFAAELISLLLFVFNADRMSDVFVGAMCAVGTLNVNAYGFPTLILKIIVFFMAAIWLILNYVDNRGYDYPLIRTKFRLLLVLAPLMAVSALVQFLYFNGLEADVITSCCSRLFTAETEGVAADLSSFSPMPTLVVFYAVLAGMLGFGVYLWRTGKGGIGFAVVAMVAFIVSISAIISVVSPYIYEHPNHHCPFCILQSGYHFVGYVLYVPLFVATAAGLGLGAIRAGRDAPSLAEIVPMVTRRLTLLSMLSIGAFACAATTAILASNLILIE